MRRLLQLFTMALAATFVLAVSDDTPMAGQATPEWESCYFSRYDCVSTECPYSWSIRRRSLVMIYWCCDEFLIPWCRETPIWTGICCF